MTGKKSTTRSFHPRPAQYIGMKSPAAIRDDLLAAASKHGKRKGGPNAAIVERLMSRYWLPSHRMNCQPHELSEADIYRMFAPWWLGLALAVREPGRFQWHTVTTAGPLALQAFTDHWLYETGQKRRPKAARKSRAKTTKQQQRAAA